LGAVLLISAVLGPIAFYVYLEIVAAAPPKRSAEASASSAALAPRPDGGRRTQVPLHQFNTENLQLPTEQIHSGGPAKDGIPSLTHPKAVKVAKASFMNPSDRVVSVTIDGKTRAYPIRILNYHEFVNDKLGRTPVGVIYCPLCDSVSVVDRRLGRETYEFGISGLLCYSNVLMYDRTDQALWSQVGLRAVSGPNAGRSLRHLDNWALQTFDQFKKAHPDATVVSTKTGHGRGGYQRNPYHGYFGNDRLVPQFKTFSLDRRMSNKAAVIGVKLGDQAKAYPLRAVGQAPGGLVADTMAGQTIRLQFDADSGAVTILEAPEDAQIVHTFWFAWAKFHPDTEIYAVAGKGEGP